ncbi:amidohydrolase family protein [Cupriavidus basilensis]|uniref:BOX element protein n=1 Tax=Cupriavidus basilensis TaxID=68895 RepID=A0A0C4Y980_9BURK|nr:amidohydrolase family protein [Cupriavidus basilensis]AJG19525.1 BOX element protein [Cupriavidus basilensis]
MRRAFVYYRSWMGGNHSRVANAPTTISMRDVLEFAPVAGARENGLDHKVGSLTPGKQADITTVLPTRLRKLLWRPGSVRPMKPEYRKALARAYFEHGLGCRRLG